MKKIIEQIKKIRWPEKKEMATLSFQTVIFMAFFAGVFLAYQLLISLAFKVVAG